MSDCLKLKIVWPNTDQEIVGELPFPDTEEGGETFFNFFVDWDENDNSHLANLEEFLAGTGIDFQSRNERPEFWITDAHLFPCTEENAKKIFDEVQRVCKLSSFS